MNCVEVQVRLNDYLDGELPPDERQDIQQHLQECSNCQRELAGFRSIQADAASLPRSISPPQDLWPRIEKRIDEQRAIAGSWKEKLRYKKNGPASVTRGSPVRTPLMTFRHRPVWVKRALPVAAVLVVMIVAFWLTSQRETTAWEVARLEGTPRVGSNPLKDVSQFKIGDWLETDNSSRARINVGSIGEVEVHPETRLRLLEASPKEHRLALDRGMIHASISAPPRIFFVETPSAVAVDLGCVYTLKVDSLGVGILRVTSGWVALEDGGRESIIPAGAMAVTRPGFGPGTPHLEDASEKFRHALERFDFQHGGSEALTALLTEARNMDSITLWHLFFRTQATDRARVYDRLASLVPPPVGVTREGMLHGDAEMIKAWQEHLNLGVKPWWRFWL